MNKIILILTLFLIFVFVNKYSNSQIVATTHDGKQVLLFENGTWQYSNNSSQVRFNLTINNDLSITLFDGQIEYFSCLSNNYVEYYSTFDITNPGKIKKIGYYEVEYFSPYDITSPGKVKKIGNYNIEYLSSFDINNPNKICKIGSYIIEYYSSIDIFSPQKVKEIGDYQIEYFNQYENYSGKVKSITGFMPDLRINYN
jgi:hypothetical protein